jgi:polyphosphate kinase
MPTAPGSMRSGCTTSASRTARIATGREPDRRARDLTVAPRDPDLAERLGVQHARPHEAKKPAGLADEVGREEAEDRVVVERACECDPRTRLFVNQPVRSWSTCRSLRAVSNKKNGRKKTNEQADQWERARFSNGEQLDRLLREVPRDKWGHPTFPIPENLSRKKYERQLHELHIELVKMQSWARAENQRVLVVFEGRDSAGKGGTIQRMLEHLNPRFARHVALQTPTDVERGQWYFQRYVEQLPTHGEIAFFDRSWYNRAGVERVMGFANEEQIELFFQQVVPFEQFLVNDGIHFVKIWLSIGQEEQVRRLNARRSDPLKQWKLSPLDEKAPQYWEDYTVALIETFRRTDSEHAPWWFVNNNAKRVGRINVIRHVLTLLPYDGKDQRVVVPPRADIVAPARIVVPELAATT